MCNQRLLWPKLLNIMTKINAILFLSLLFSLFRFPLQLNKYSRYISFHFFIYFVAPYFIFQKCSNYRYETRNMNVMYICVLNAFSPN